MHTEVVHKFDSLNVSSIKNGNWDFKSRQSCREQDGKLKNYYYFLIIIQVCNILKSLGKVNWPLITNSRSVTKLCIGG